MCTQNSLKYLKNETKSLSQNADSWFIFWLDYNKIIVIKLIEKQNKECYYKRTSEDYVEASVAHRVKSRVCSKAHDKPQQRRSDGSYLSVFAVSRGFALSVGLTAHLDAVARLRLELHGGNGGDWRHWKTENTVSLHQKHNIIMWKTRRENHSLL